MENKDNDIELLAGQVWNAPERPEAGSGGAMIALAERLLKKRLAAEAHMRKILDEAEDISSVREVPAGRPDWAAKILVETAKFLKPQWPPHPPHMYGDKWTEEDQAALRAQPTRNRFEFNRISIVPQAEIVRHPIPPELSELHPAAPDYRDLLGHKRGSE